MTDENQQAQAGAPVRKESDVYDRQIRLWGAEAQAKMAKAKVLYIHLTGVSTEILKNLVLAGIRAVLCDNRPYPDAVMDTPSFFLSGPERAPPLENEPAPKKVKHGSVAQAMKPAVQDLNPLLGECKVVDSDPSDLAPEFLSEFSVVVASRLNMEQAVRISKATVAGGGKFYMVDTFGLSGACVLDLGEGHEYRPEVGKKLLDPTKVNTHVPLETLFQVPLSEAVNRFYKTPPLEWMRYRCLLEYVKQKKTWPSRETADDFVQVIQSWVEDSDSSLSDHDLVGDKQALEKLACVATSEVAPVCAVLGGVVGNEVIKVISGKGEPANNTVLLDGLSCKAMTFLIQPKN